MERLQLKWRMIRMSSDFDRDFLDKSQMILSFGYSSMGVLIDSIRAFALAFRTYDGDKLKKALEEYKGKTFSDEATWSLYNKAQGTKEYGELTIESKQELRIFQKLTKDWGIDILITQRPRDLDEIIEKANRQDALTNRESRLLQQFAYQEDNQYIAKKEACVITFSADKLDKMENITFEMEARMNTLQKRKERAKEKGRKLRESFQDKDKNLSIEKGKEAR